MARRLPHANCIVCDRPHVEVGGARLVADGTHCIRVCTPDDRIGNIAAPAKIIRLSGDFRDVIVAMSGGRFWTEAVVDRVRDVCEAGTRPWFCQRCAKRDLCPTCGTPMTAVPMADHMLDDGKTVHSPHVMGYGRSRRCPNSQCSDYVPPASVIE